MLLETRGFYFLLSKRGEKVTMYKESFAERLKKARADTGFTQAEVAKATGISQPIIAYLETGKREPSLENLGILADFYGVSTDWLLSIAPKKKS